MILIFISIISSCRVRSFCGVHQISVVRDGFPLVFADAAPSVSWSNLTESASWHSGTVLQEFSVATRCTWDHPERIPSYKPSINGTTQEGTTPYCGLT